MSKAKKVVTFRDIWLKNYPEFSRWLEKDKSDCTKFSCTVCAESVSLSNMGIGAIKSHNSSKKHRNNIASAKTTTKMQNFFSTAGSKSSSGSHSFEKDHSPTSSKAKQSSVVPFTSSSDMCSKAEILWAVKCIECNFSGSSCDHTHELFSQMFSDSKIACNYSMGRTKFAYVTNFGIAPFLFKHLKERVMISPLFSVSFDESVNEALGKVQMDFIIRFWNIESKESVTHYYTSKFTGVCNAETLFTLFNEALAGLDQSKMVQVAMDGPNVNWALYSKIEAQRRIKNQPSLISAGSCSLHIVHGAFQHGAQSSQWALDSFLKALHKLFANYAPARRAFHFSSTGSTKFPAKFCNIRWVESKPVAERALEVIEDIKKTCKKWEELPKSGRPQCGSYAIVVNAFKDVLLISKLHFFSYVASILEQFLKKYQQNNPIVPMWYDDVMEMLRNLVQVIVKPVHVDAVMKEVFTYKFDTHQQTSHTRKFADIGTAAKLHLEKLKRTDVIGECQEYDFHMSCKKFVVRVILKLRERLAKGFRFFKLASALNPENLERLGKIKLVSRMKKLVRSLAASKIVSPQCGDEAVSKFETLVRHQSQQFLTYKGERLDHFYFTTLGIDQSSSLAKAIMPVLVMHNGQADVERGFSVNNEVAGINVSEQTIITKRLLKDHLTTKKISAHDMEIPKQLMLSVRESRARYHLHLEKKRKEKLVTDLDIQAKSLKSSLADTQRDRQRKVELIASLRDEALALFDKAFQEKDSFKRDLLLAKGRAEKAQSEQLKLDLLDIDKKIVDIQGQIDRLH